MLAGLHGHQAPTRHRSIIAESVSGGPRLSRCRAVWAFAADRISGRLGRHLGSQCPRRVAAAAVNVGQQVASGIQGDLRPQQPPTPSHNSALLSDPKLLDAAPAAPQPASNPPIQEQVITPRPIRAGAATRAAPPPSSDPDAVLDSFVTAFGLPRQQLRMVLERQPALQRASPILLSDRIAAFTRATGLPAYQLLYMVARRPTLLRLAPSVLPALVDELARRLGLRREDGVRLVLAQPALLELRPATVRALMQRVCEEMGVKPRVGLKILVGLPPEQLNALLEPRGVLRQRYKGLRRVIARISERRAMPSAAVLLAVRCPRLLALPSKAVSASMAALMSMLPTKDVRGGAGGRSMLDAVMACPHLLSLPPETLRSRFVALAAAARIDTPAVVSMMLLEPRLLLADPARVRARLEALTFSLMVPRRAALDMVVRQPQLLLCYPETLADNWAALQGLLGTTFEVVLSIVTRHPRLLCMPASRLSSKLAALEAAFGLPHARAVLLAVSWPALLTMSETRYQGKYRLLSRLIGGLDTPAMGRLVLREPYLVLEDGIRLRAKMREAASCLAVARTTVGDMISRSPRFITHDPSRWQANLDVLVSGLGVSREQACAAACRYPRLLAVETAELSSSVSTTMALLRRSRPWMALLQRADPELVFKCADGYNERVREHLRFLLDTGLHAQQSLVSPIIWDRPSFLQRYPAFDRWQRERAAAAAVPIGSPFVEPGPASGGAGGVPREAALATGAGLAVAAPAAASAADGPGSGSVTSNAEPPSGVVPLAGDQGSLPPDAGRQADGRSAASGGADMPGAGFGTKSGYAAARSAAKGQGSKAGSGSGASGHKQRKLAVSRRKRMVVLPSVSSTDE